MSKQDKKVPNIAILLLAAGASRRMKRAKQLLPWQNQSLIEHQIATLLKIDLRVYVILGANADQIRPQIHEWPVTISTNADWEKGMGNSLAFGVREVVEKSSEVSGVLITLVDQPFLEVNHFNKLLRTFTPGQRQIICSQSDKGWSGPPVLFDAIYFDELMEQNGDDGAKQLTKKYKDAITFVTLGDAIEDMDTPDAFAKANLKASRPKGE